MSSFSAASNEGLSPQKKGDFEELGPSEFLRFHQVYPKMYGLDYKETKTVDSKQATHVMSSQKSRTTSRKSPSIIDNLNSPNDSLNDAHFKMGVDLASAQSTFA